MTREELNRYLKTLIEYKGSDLHIKSGNGVKARIRGKLVKIESPTYTRESLIQLAKEILRSRFEELVKNKEVDFNYKLNDDFRFRGNVFFQIDGPSFVFRIIPTKILTMEELNLPPVMKKFTQLERGLVLVTGATGSGKSTTLASIINEINHTQYKHIITIEDPVEFVHKDDKSLVNQRNIGEDTLSFARALRAALREDPDIILVGEMRDLETIEIALHAAETGHLVFSTLHTIDAKETINRIISMFPTEEQNRIRLSLASVLEGVVSQRLVPTVDNKRTAALEILLKTARVKELILNNRDLEITDALEEGKKVYGTQSFDQHLVELVVQGKISEKDAIENASNKDDFLLKLRKAKLELGLDTVGDSIGLKKDSDDMKILKF